MHTTNLRKVGGSIMLAVPPALLNLLRLKAGATVAVGVENGHCRAAAAPTLYVGGVARSVRLLAAATT